MPKSANHLWIATSNICCVKVGLTEQIDQLRDISRVNDDTASKVRESIEILYEKRISINTEKFEQLNHYFITEMENKLRKVKQPSRGLKWYIVMWVITLASAFLAGYFIHEYREWKEKAMYWYQQYEEVKEKPQETKSKPAKRK